MEQQDEVSRGSFSSDMASMLRGLQQDLLFSRLGYAIPLGPGADMLSATAP
jgi:hypothetical protein